MYDGTNVGNAIELWRNAVIGPYAYGYHVGANPKGIEGTEIDAPGANWIAVGTYVGRSPLFREDINDLHITKMDQQLDFMVGSWTVVQTLLREIMCLVVVQDNLRHARDTTEKVLSTQYNEVAKHNMRNERQADLYHSTLSVVATSLSRIAGEINDDFPEQADALTQLWRLIDNVTTHDGTS
jgi:hypothetical protein